MSTLYGVTSLLLLIFRPGSSIIQSLQKYLKEQKDHNEKHKNIVRYRIWLKLPLHGILDMAELLMAIILATLFYTLATIQQLNVI